MEWDDAVISMQPDTVEHPQSYFADEPDAVRQAMERLRDILDAKYEKADLDKVVDQCDYLTKNQKHQLLHVLNKFSDLFDGTLGKWNMGAYDIQLRPGATPYHAKPYPIPYSRLQTLKIEVDRLVKAGVLRKVNRSEWGAPTFIIAKKDGSVRIISDFRELNKRICRKPFPIPRIQDMLLKLEGFQFATSLDLNMGYYHIELSPHSRE